MERSTENKFHSFNLPSSYQAGLRKIADQQRMANMLQQQAQAPTERFSYKGIEAHTPATAGLAKILQGLTGTYLQGKARDEEEALSKKYGEDQKADMSAIMAGLTAPAVAGVTEIPMPSEEQGGGPGREAVAARGAGQIDSSLIGQMNLPENSNRVLALVMAQRQAEIDAERLARKPSFGQPVYETINGKTHAVVYDKSGNRKVIGEVKPVDKFTTPTVDSQLNRDLKLYIHGTLSAEQRESLRLRLINAGVDVTRLHYETGQSPAQLGGAPNNPPAPAPLGTPNSPEPNNQAVTTPLVPSNLTTPNNPPVRIMGGAHAGQAADNSPIPRIASSPPKERQKLIADRPAQTASAQTSLQNIDRLISVTSELMNHPGLDSIVGKLNQYSTFDVTDDAVNARALQGTLVKQSAVAALQAMRDASKTGGAVGNVTEKEWPILEQQLAALDSAQTTEAYKTALTNLLAQLSASSNRVRKAYTATYGPLDYKKATYAEQTQAGTAPEGAVRRIK